MTDDTPFRALVAPFTVPDDFDPIFGSCSRCGGDAILIESGWHHDGKGCDPHRAEAAQFIPDLPEG